MEAIAGPDYLQFRNTDIFLHEVTASNAQGALAYGRA